MGSQSLLPTSKPFDIGNSTIYSRVSRSSIDNTETATFVNSAKFPTTPLGRAKGTETMTTNSSFTSIKDDCTRKQGAETMPSLPLKAYFSSLQKDFRNSTMRKDSC